MATQHHSHPLTHSVLQKKTTHRDWMAGQKMGGFHRLAVVRDPELDILFLKEQRSTETSSHRSSVQKGQAAKSFARLWMLITADPCWNNGRLYFPEPAPHLLIISCKMPRCTISFQREINCFGICGFNQANRQFILFLFHDKSCITVRPECTSPLGFLPPTPKRLSLFCLAY